MRTVGFFAIALVAGGCVFGGGSGTSSEPDAEVIDDRPRYASGHLFRKEITVSPTAGADLFDFVLGVFAVSDSGLAAEALEDGGDLLLTEADGETPVPFELESFDKSTGSFALWVHMNPLEDRTFYLYYGANDPVVTDADIWPASFRAVWHGGVDGQGAIDSSKSSLAANATNTDLPSATAGVTGTAFDFSSPAGCARFEVASPAPLTFASDSFSFSAWVFLGPSTGPVSRGRPWHFGGEDTGNPGYGIDFTQGVARATLADPSNTFAADFGAVSSMVGDWVHLVAAVDRASDNIQTYVNGRPANTGNVLDAADLTPGVAARLGGPDASPFTGQLDEVRVSSSVPAAVRVRAEYENLTNPAFFSIGDAEAPE